MRRTFMVLCLAALAAACTSSDDAGDSITTIASSTPESATTSSTVVDQETAELYLEQVNTVSQATLDEISAAALAALPEIAEADDEGDTVIDWEMPPRWEDGYNAYDIIGRSDDGFDLLWGWDPKYVDPDAWEVELISCDTLLPGTASEYTWTLTAEDGWTDSFTSSNCRTEVEVPHLGEYDVSLDIETENGPVSGSKSITVGDLLIVHMGDSSASGEGNPLDIERYDGFTWEDDRCHRSRNAGGARAAEALENADPHISVTWVHLGCSGAKLGTGVLFEYMGQEPPEETDTPLESQLHQIQRALCSGDDPVTCDREPHRVIDHLLLQVGVNDLGFATIVKECAWRVGCHENEDLNDLIEYGLKILPTEFYTYNLQRWPGCDDPTCGGRSPLTGYGEVTERLINAGITVEKTYLIGYPNGLFGNTEGKTVRGCGALIEVGVAEGEWMKTAALRLNELLRVEALLMGATPVLDFASDFERHGYCAGESVRVVTSRGAWDENTESWFVPITGSLAQQENIDGSVHPNGEGHARIAESILRALASERDDFDPTRTVHVYLDRMRLTEPGVTANFHGDQPVDLYITGVAQIRDPVTNKLFDLFRTGPAVIETVDLTPGQWSGNGRRHSFSIEWNPAYESIRLYFGFNRPALKDIMESQLYFLQENEIIRNSELGAIDITNPEPLPPPDPPDPWTDTRQFSVRLTLESQPNGPFESVVVNQSVTDERFSAGEGGTFEMRFCVLDSPVPPPILELPAQQRCENLLVGGSGEVVDS